MKMIGDRFGRKLSVASRRRAKKNRVPEPGRKPTPLLLECLEPRQLMAADVDVAISSPVPHTATTGEVRAHLEDRVLRIEGTDQPDRIIVRELSGEIVIDDVMIQKRGGSVRRMPLEEIDRIDIFGNGRDDVLALLINDLAPLANGAGVYGGSGRVEDHLAIFENRMRSSDPAERLAPEFAYSSTKFDDFMERSESSNGDGNAYDHSFMRLDYLVLRALSEKGAPRGTGDSVHGWSRSFVEAAENMLAGLEETLRTQWRRLQSDLVSLVRKLRDELNLSIGEVAGIVHGVSRDLGVFS